MKLVWTSEALTDRVGIFDFIALDNSAMALALDELFSEKAMRLADHPMLGRQGRAAGTRELVLFRNYILIYEIAEETINILRLLHASMQWPNQK